MVNLNTSLSEAQGSINYIGQYTTIGEEILVLFIDKIKIPAHIYQL